MHLAELNQVRVRPAIALFAHNPNFNPKQPASPANPRAILA